VHVHSCKSSNEMLFNCCDCPFCSVDLMVVGGTSWMLIFSDLMYFSTAAEHSYNGQGSNDNDNDPRGNDDVDDVPTLSAPPT
jgi:hypothetical protein